MKNRLFAICCFLCVLIQSTSASAQKGKIRIGKMKIITSITVRSTYDDNIYLGSGTDSIGERKEPDWIYHITPAINLTYSLNQRGGIKIGYLGNLAYYSKNDLNDWDSHRGIFNLDYRSPEGLIAGVNNTYLYTEDPYGSENQFKVGVPQTERWSNNLNTKIGYDFGNRLVGMTFFNYFKQDYENLEDYTQDYNSHELGTGFRYRLLPRTWTFIRYHFGERDYFTHPGGTGVTEENDSDFDWHRVNTGFLWDATAKLRGELNFGYTWKDYANAFDTNGAMYNDKRTWVAATSLSFKVSTTTTYGLQLTRSLRESGSDTNEYFMDSGIGLSIRKTLLPKIVMTMGGVYSLNEYNLPRDDDRLKANIVFDYKIQDWLNTKIGYNYSKRDSNQDANDYSNHQFIISFKGGY